MLLWISSVNINSCVIYTEFKYNSKAIFSNVAQHVKNVITKAARSCLRHSTVSMKLEKPILGKEKVQKYFSPGVV